MIHMGEACLFHLLAVVVLLLVLKWRPTVGGTERIELKFSLKIALEYKCLANKLHSETRLVGSVQYSKIDLGFHDFHLNYTISPF